MSPGLLSEFATDLLDPAISLEIKKHPNAIIYNNNAFYGPTIEDGDVDYISVPMFEIYAMGKTSEEALEALDERIEKICKEMIQFELISNFRTGADGRIIVQRGEGVVPKDREHTEYISFIEIGFTILRG
jgi:predicted RNase H-like HicB family nuclease